MDAAVRSSLTLVSALAELGEGEYNPRTSFEAAWDAVEETPTTIPPPPRSPPPPEEDDEEERRRIAAAQWRKQENGRRCSTRLYVDASDRREQRMLQKLAIEEDEVAECGFAPNINPHSRHLQRRPMHERVADLEKQAALRRVELELKLERERSKTETFRPEIDDRSKRLFTRTKASTRLSEDAWRRAMAEKERAAAATAAAEAKRQLESTFRARSARGGGGGEKGKGPSFEERERRRYLMRVQKDQERVAKEREENAKLFRPATHSRRGRSRGVEELSRDYERLRVKRETKKRAEIMEIPFAPTLVAKRRNNVESDLMNQRGKEAREKAMRKIEEQRRKEYTFRPRVISTNATPRVFQSPDPEKVQEKRAKALREQELRELQECSFKPKVRTKKTHRSDPPAVAPVVIRGLARHLELKARADKLNAEQRRREHRAFNVEKADDWRNGKNYTTPVPFQLTGNVKEDDRYLRPHVDDESLTSY